MHGHYTYVHVCKYVCMYVCTTQAELANATNTCTCQARSKQFEVGQVRKWVSVAINNESLEVGACG